MFYHDIHHYIKCYMVACYKVNSIVPMKKSNGSLRLCLDPNDLNKNKFNQGYSKVIDDILPDLSGSNLFTLLGAKSGYWHVILDKDSRLMITFNTPRGKVRWLWLPFGLKVAGYIFQERLDRVIRGIPNVHSIANDVLVDGKVEVPHDQSIMTLPEAAIVSNITFNHDKFVFKTKDLRFFDWHLTPKGYKVDPKMVQAITEMKSPQNLQDLEWPGTSQLLQLLQSKVNRADNTT